MLSCSKSLSANSFLFSLFDPMNLKLKILLLATLPLILAIAAITLLVSHQAKELSR